MINKDSSRINRAGVPVCVSRPSAERSGVLRCRQLCKANPIWLGPNGMEMLSYQAVRRGVSGYGRGEAKPIKANWGRQETGGRRLEGNGSRETGDESRVMAPNKANFCVIGLEMGLGRKNKANFGGGGIVRGSLAVGQRRLESAGASRYDRRLAGCGRFRVQPDERKRSNGNTGTSKGRHYGTL
jgi:hypothetical protein